MTDPNADVVSSETTAPAIAPGPLSPLRWSALVLATAGALLLGGGVLFAFASADAQRLGDTDRFRLLGQAANPFIAFLVLAAIALVQSRTPSAPPQVSPRAAIGVATAVSVAVILLAVNGILTDLTGSTTALFRLSAIISRLGTVAMSVFALWLASGRATKS